MYKTFYYGTITERNGQPNDRGEEEHKSEQLGQQQGSNADEFSHETNDLIPDFKHYVYKQIQNLRKIRFL